jgi:hypothetical protein
MQDKKPKKKLLTPQDKIHLMAKKNKELLDLMKEFNLQIT